MGIVHSTGLMRLDARATIMELTHGPISLHLWFTCWSDCLSDLGFSESPGLSPAFGLLTREITRLRVNRIYGHRAGTMVDGLPRALRSGHQQWRCLHRLYRVLVHELSNQKCEEAYELLFMVVCFLGISFVLASLPRADLAQQEPSVFARGRPLMYQSVGKHGEMDRHCCDGFAVPNRFLQSLLAQCHRRMIMHLGATAMISERAPPWQWHYLMHNLPMPAAMWLVDTVI